MGPLHLLVLALSFAGLGFSRKGRALGRKELLFYGPSVGKELDIAVQNLGFTANVMDETEWSALTEADAKSYRAIVFGDPNCVGGSAILNTAVNNRAVWSAAVKGNVILIGTDPTFHAPLQPGAVDLMSQALSFVTTKPGHTGLYMTLSCYYAGSPETTVQVLDQFGTFGIRGASLCSNQAHLVAGGGPLDALTDAELSNWWCSVHEVFTQTPPAFAALAISEDDTGSGVTQFGDGSTGTPYIIARGLKIHGCGNGKKDKGEECDDGNNEDGDGCSSCCKKEH